MQCWEQANRVRPPSAAMGWALCPKKHNFHSQTGTHTHHPQWVKPMRWQKSVALSNSSLLKYFYIFFSAGQRLQQEPRWFYFNSNCSHVQKIVLELVPCTERRWMSSAQLQHKPACFHRQKIWIENKLPAPSTSSGFRVVTKVSHAKKDELWK